MSFFYAAADEDHDDDDCDDYNYSLNDGGEVDHVVVVTIIKDIQEVCLIENWSSAKVTMRSCFLFENSALDQNFNIMFFSFFTMR